MSKSSLELRFFGNKISKLKALHRPNELNLLALVLIISAAFTELLWRMTTYHDDFSPKVFTKFLNLLVAL